ncbi:DUF1501 domain-containing protein [Sabulicella glaciei]|uniref:DUF1501 domain-containing protein n=1 Tax=Sabulicella glaciei TaxID=2984948 RepID=A0ABT3NXQ5_9PROT|nr:DUF1501 domain-containing protein [Roseococcus sp. MDT2-1-1]MCW8086908.1 DUF1501 domain-containing protein [Roseococcus sp. MDT2-1-1]
MMQRRLFLSGISALGLGASRLALAAGPAGDARLVVVNLRGALDGLAAVPPIGDSGLAALRGEAWAFEPGTEGGALDLDGRFGLHPSLEGMHALFTAREALVFHAVAGPWRSRSHFEAQDLLEGGTERRTESGWLNRALSVLPAEPRGEPRIGLSLGSAMPLLMRGNRPVGSFTVPDLPRAAPETLEVLARWHATDPLLASGFSDGLRGRRFGNAAVGGDPALRDRDGFRRLSHVAGRMLAQRPGPRVAALDLGGWDTHVGQAARLRGLLAQLDAGLLALRDGLGDAWGRTAVLVMTEFGRTARVNGSAGTDHGTGGAAFLLGGAVAGGRVIADWPGLLPSRLLEGRDLLPTLDLRRLAKALLRDHLALPEEALERAFPGSIAVTPLPGLFRPA